MKMTVVDLLRRACAMEREAAERYQELAAQMYAVNNRKVAAIFQKLATVEAKHAREISQHLERLGDDIAAMPDYEWESPEGPETAAYEDMHYLMGEKQALELALHNEQRAVDYFRLLQSLSLPDDVMRLTEDFLTEEREHVALVSDMLAKTDHHDPDRLDDDPPTPQ